MVWQHGVGIQKYHAATSPFSATANGSTPEGNYTFNVTQLATATSVAGSSIAATLDNTSQTLANLDIGATITAGNFTVNGQTITVAITDTLQKRFDQLSISATGGAVTPRFEWPGRF